MKASTKKIKAVSGRVDYVGRFTWGDGRKAIKAVINTDEAYRKKFGDRVELIFFRQGLQEMLMDAHLNPDGTWKFGNKKLERDDHLAAKGDYKETPWKKGKKKGINRTIVVASKADLTWQRIAPIDFDPWASSDEESEDNESVAEKAI